MFRMKKTGKIFRYRPEACGISSFFSRKKAMAPHKQTREKMTRTLPQN